MSEKPSKPILGLGLDIGTMNVVSARRTAKGVETRRMRDAFLDLDPGAKKMLKLGNVNYVERGGELLVLGDAALEMSNVFGREPRRPLSGGLLAAGEMDALEVLALIVKHVVGEPLEKGEACCFSVPAAPVDAPDRDIIYHRGVLERIVTECGYNAIPSNEAMAVIFAETAKDGFSGLGFSFGSGMTNCALAINTIEGMSFSVARGGDSIDAGAAKATGSTQARICALKEKGIDLVHPKSREEEALALYYKNLVEHVLDQVSTRFQQVKGQFALPKAIPIVISGGTSLAGGFKEFFEQVFEKKRKRFPIEISEIRQAKDPLNAVAQGLLLQAMQEHDA